MFIEKTPLMTKLRSLAAELRSLAIARWARRKLPAHLLADLDLIERSGYFNEEWYKATYSDVAAAGISGIFHYLQHGWKEGRSPGPKFNAAWYLKQYPDIVNIDPLSHYLRFGKVEGRHPAPPTDVLAVVEAVLKEVQDLDPALYTVNYLHDPYRLKILDAKPRSRLAAAFKNLVGGLISPPDFIVFLPWLTHGGADLVASHAIRALRENTSSQILVVLTDDAATEAKHLIPDEISVVSLSASCSELTGSERRELVSLLIRSFSPRAVLNVNSRAAWEAMRNDGAILSQFTQLFAMLFCPDYLDDGRRIGYSDEYFSDCLATLRGVYFDNETHIAELVHRFQIPKSLQKKLVLLYQPAPSIVPPQRERGDRLNVLWAGRLARQKNVELLLQILDAAPADQEFHIWGRGNPEYEQRLKRLEESRDNVHFYGKYESFTCLPLKNYDALLYTSLWDGLPNVILEGAAAELPIVASDVGGIGEIVNARTGWLIPDINNPQAYIDALQTIRENVAESTTRIRAMRERLSEKHHLKTYVDILKTQPRETGGLIVARPHSNRHSYSSSRGSSRASINDERTTSSGDSA